MPLRPEDVRTLEILSSVLHGEGWTFVVIGATVPWILATRSTGLRGTRDIDVVVNTTSWDDFERAGSRLRDAGFAQRRLHEFISPHGTRIDLLPYGQGLVQGDTIAWPDGMTMSALGLAEAFDSAAERQITEALSVRPDRYLRPLRGGGRPPVRALRRQRRQFATPVRGSGSLLARH